MSRYELNEGSSNKAKDSFAGSEGLLPPRIEHENTLIDLASGGLTYMSIKDALEDPERARMVEMNKPDPKLKKLTAVFCLDLGNSLPPPWIGEMTSLRVLKCSSPKLKQLPAGVLKLPKLRELYLEDSGLASLAGVEKLPALETLSLGDTPIANDADTLAAAIKKIPGASTTRFMSGAQIERKPIKPKGALSKMLANNTMPDTADLRGANLSGGTFENLQCAQNFTGAKLANTTWRGCDFHYATFAKADLTGATFIDCYFMSSRVKGAIFANAKLGKASFLGCGGDLDAPGADLRGARIDLAWAARLDITNANAQGLVLRAMFSSEREHNIKTSKADLRGATAMFDVTPFRISEIKRKSGAKIAWKTDHFAGAKTDKTTRIIYQSLPAKGATAPAVDPVGASAVLLGRIDAINAALWVLAIDGKAATAWNGSENDDETDFNRAMKKSEGSISVGTSSGVIATIAPFTGYSYVWRIPNGIAMIDMTTHGDDKATLQRELALRVAQWPVHKSKKLGSLKITSGTLGLMLPYRAGTFSAAELAKGKTEVVKNRDGDRLLLPLPNGTYDVTRSPFGPTPKEYEDELGEYLGVVRITASR